MSKQLAERCDGPRLRRALSDAAAWLEAQAPEIDALNVFPVPDGDTGTNMSLTLRAAVRQVAAEPQDSVGAVARAAAHGALLGARGNSGVILSQFLRGIARSLENRTDIGPTELARALTLGSATAQKAVIRPVEGTILTVGRDAARAALAASREGGTLSAVLDAAIAGARASVARTPSLLPVLRQAGVVDAGGQGLLCLLEGLGRSLRGEVEPEAPTEDAVGAAPALSPAGYGYCTEFLLRGARLNLEAVRAAVVEMGDSALVVGDGDVVRVHVHTYRPGRVLEWASDLGTLHQIKIDNMQDQHEHVLVGKAGLPGPGGHAPEPTGISPNGAVPERAVASDGRPEPGAASDQPAMVVVAAGPGFTGIFKSLGVAVVVPGGQTMNPSTEDLLRAVGQAPSRQVLLLPNNGNVVLAAKQVGLLTDKETAVVPTQDMAQGVAAALAFRPGEGLAENARAMERALRSVRTGALTPAVRAAKLDGFEVRAGELLGLVEGRLVATGDDPAEVVCRMLDDLGAEQAEVVTLYYGADVDDSQAQALAALVRERYAGRAAAVEVLSGGQPIYHYVVAVE